MGEFKFLDVIFGLNGHNDSLHLPQGSLPHMCGEHY